VTDEASPLRTDELRSSLRAAGLRVTRQRLAVLEALATRSDAVTAQDLHHELRKGAGSPGLATVYRTLTALSEAGQLDTFPRDGEQAFRLCGTDHHHHLVCENCGSVREVEGAEVETWVGRTARRHGFRVTGHRADIYGVCKACR
jgi:Fur family transcriptional regulator, ferric uptake regulator